MATMTTSADIERSCPNVGEVATTVRSGQSCARPATTPRSWRARFSDTAWLIDRRDIDSAGAQSVDDFRRMEVDTRALDMPALESSEV